MTEEMCPKCGNPLSEVIETPTGKKLQRCSTGFWNKDTKKNEGLTLALRIVTVRTNRSGIQIKEKLTLVLEFYLVYGQD